MRKLRVITELNQGLPLSSLQRRRASSSKKQAIGTFLLVVIVIVIIVAAGLGYYAYEASTTANVSKGSTTSSGPLLLYSADAYENESTLLEQGFASQSGVTVTTAQDAGSSSLAVEIKAGDPVSVFLSVSRAAIENASLGSEFPGWAVAFAGDEMGIAYSSATSQTPSGEAVISSYNAAVTQNTTKAWYSFFDNLTSGSVKVGISNPNDDPAGYRAWIVLKLAGESFAGSESYFVNRMVSNRANVTDTSAAALVPALDTGNIQFLFIYKSDISSSGLNLIQLTNSVNLGYPAENSFYSTANYTTSGGVETGSAIQLWLSVPKDSTNTNESVTFVVYVLDNYQRVLSKFGLVPFTPGRLYNDTGYSVPSPIISLLSTGKLADEGSVE